MSSLFFFPHLGLGDHIICHGIVVELLKDYDKIIMPVKNHNVKSVEFLCQGLNVCIIPVDDDMGAYKAAKETEGDHLGLGFHGKNFLRDHNNFSKSFYEQAHVEFSKAWDNFKIKRNMQAENKLCEGLINTRPFAFVHDDKSRDLVAHKLKTSLPIVRPSKSLSDTIFDYCSIIEEADELHLIDSSFALLADRLSLKAQRKVIHRYVRLDRSKGAQELMPTHYKQEWEYVL